MDPKKLAKIEAIYHQASARNPSERTSFIREASGGDEELIAEVESLLSISDETGDFLETPPESLAAEMLYENGNLHELVGREIGNFKILKSLGTGGMGEVYLAEDKKLRRLVALKTLPDDYLAIPTDDRGFEQEAHALSALNHPNIITIYEIAEVGSLKFIVTEYIDGRTLREVMRDNPPSTADALAIAVQVAGALESAHSVGIIHRDIKPANVMIRKDGIVKVLDFGIAKLVDLSDDDAAPTAAGRVIGTASYMSPEQARAGAVDSRTDIFSFGVLLYEFFAGRLPFSGEGSVEILAAVQNDEPASLTDSGVDPKLSAVIMRCLKKNRDERFSSIGEVRRELERVKISNSYDTSATKALETGEIKSTGTISRRLLLVGIVAVLIALAGFVGFRQLTEQRQIRSIAVMPFANESGNKEFEYLSDGMTENLIRSLATIPQLSIKSRSIVFGYKGKDFTPQKIAADLKVDAVLLGRLSQRGDSLRISLELVDSATNDVLWTEIYERRLSSLVLLESEIATSVSQNLRLKLTPSELGKVARSYTSDSEAQRLYLKGRFHWNKRQVADLEIAAKYFNEAIAKDPNHAPAYAGLADSYALTPLYSNVPAKDFMPKAKAAALKAIELDPNLAEPHASLAYIVNSYEYDWKTAEREHQLALRLNPNYATARQWYAEHLAFQGRTDEALTEISIALELNPFSVTINRMKGNILLFAGRKQEAIAQLTKTIELFPENPTVRFNLADAFASEKLYDEAVREYLTGFKSSGFSTGELQKLDSAFRNRGWLGFWIEYRDILLAERAEILRNDPNAYISGETYALAFAATGDKKRALDELERAFEQREVSLISLRLAEFYEILKDEPRYLDLLRKIGLG